MSEGKNQVRVWGAWRCCQSDRLSEPFELTLSVNACTDISKSDTMIVGTGSSSIDVSRTWYS